MPTAPAADQARLLDVQALDTRLAQVAHRRRSLPEHAELADLQARARAVRDQLVAASTIASDVERELARAERDVEQVRARAERDQQRLDAGKGTPGDLLALQSELRSLARRQGDLEEVQLEVMERLEGAQAAAAHLQGEADDLAARQQEVTARRDAAVAELDAEAARLTAERAAAVDGLDAALVALYERVRAHSGGSGAALLRGSQCEGCRLTLNATELGRIRTAGPDEVLRCEECGRILVRQPQGAA